MKLNIKKVATVLGSALMLGATAGMAAAASFTPSSFGDGGIALVVGANAANSDLKAAVDLTSNLAGDLAAQTATGASVSVTGDAVSLDAGSTKIWMNTSLNTAKTTLTKSDLPTVLGEYTFSGNVDSKLTSTISVGTNKVTFAKQPSSNDDPVIGITLGSTSADPLYTATVTMPAIAFNNTDSEGETIKLFGRDFVISTATDATDLVLFSSAKEISLSAGGADSVMSQDVTIGDNTYTIALVTGTSTTATISVNGDSKEINEGASKKIGGIDIAVKSVTESTALSTVTASLLVGSEKITFTNGTQVLMGSDDDPVDGTLVTFTGMPNNLTGLSIAVYAPTSSEDAILAGESFVDPVFGSFKVDFSGLNVPLDSSARETIKVDKSGDKGMSLTMTDSDGYEKSFDFIYNATTTFLGDSNSYRIKLTEGASLTENNYTIVGNEDYGHLLQVTRIYNNTGSDYSKDSVTLKDVISGDSYTMDATAEGTGRLTLDGRQYTLTYSGSGDTGTVSIKYPTSDVSATQYVVFPTIETKNGALVQLYEPQTISLTGKSGLKIADGDGYTTITTLYAGNSTGGYEDMWNITDVAGTTTLNTSATAIVNVTVGELSYTIGGLATGNSTTISLRNPSTGAAISTPGLVVLEGKDDLSVYEAIVAYTDASAGTSSDPVGIGTVVSTSPYYSTNSLQSDSDISQSVTWYGSLVTEDSNTASQKTVAISYPKEQVYANIFVGEESATITAGSDGGSVTSLGSVTVYDNEVSSVSGKNLIVIGGSCINSVAAELLGGAACDDAFTAKTGIKAGEALIQSFTRGSKVALLVAGFNAADTTKAVTYLSNKPIDTTVGKALKVTSATEATAITA